MIIVQQAEVKIGKIRFRVRAFVRKVKNTVLVQAELDKTIKQLRDFNSLRK